MRIIKIKGEMVKNIFLFIFLSLLLVHFVAADDLESAFKNTMSKSVNAVNEQYLKDKNLVLDVPLETKKFDGYIVEFEKNPIIKEMKNIEKRTSKERVLGEVEKYKSTLQSENKKIKQRIASELNGGQLSSLNPFIAFWNMITGKAVSNSEIDPSLISDEFDVAFNGIVLKIDEETAEKLKNVQGVKSVKPNYEVHTMLMDSVPLIGADSVWQLDSDGNNCAESGKECLTGKGISIAIIDTGVDYTHPDLGGCFGTNCKVAGGYDVINRDKDPIDDMGHGTHVAGIAVGSGAGGLKGVAPDATIYAYKVLDVNGYGTLQSVISGIERAVDLNRNKIPCENKIIGGYIEDYADIISLSLGGYGDPDDSVSTAIDNAALCTIPVIAAGNSGSSYFTVGSPGTARKSITVGATYKKDYEGKYWGDTNPRADQITSFSSRGPVYWIDKNNNYKFLIKPDIVAPGAIICSARYDSIFPEGSHDYYYPCLDENHVQLAGTSMATPIVSGAVALLKQKNPSWTSDEMKMALRNTANKLINPTTNKEYDIFTQGYGRINSKQMVDLKHKPVIARIETKKSEILYGNEELDVRGSAFGENFKEYKLYYGAGTEPSEWIEFAKGTNAVEENVLYKSFKTNLLPQGFNFLRIVVWNSFGEQSEDRVLLYIYEPLIENKQITTDKKVQVSPAIYGDKIVWTDWRNEIIIRDGVDNVDIYMYTLANNKERQITTNSKSQSDPDIYENLLVWEDQRRGNGDIYLYDSSRNKEWRITSNTEWQNYPAIYGDKIVWTDYRNGNTDIYMYDFTINKEIPIINDGNGQLYPDIYGDKIVWFDSRDNGAIYLYDLSTKNEMQLSNNLIYDVAPSIYGTIISWCEDGYVYVYNLSINQKKKISENTHFKNCGTAVSGDKIVWEDYRNGNMDIYMYDLSTNQERSIANEVNWQVQPQIYGDKIVWEDWRNGRGDIYMYEIK